VATIGLSLISYSLGRAFDSSSFLFAIFCFFPGVGLLWLALVIALTKSAKKGGADYSDVQEMRRETPREAVQRNIVASYLTASNNPSSRSVSGPMGPYDPRTNEKFKPEERRYD
jgi:hypothetical protein